MNWPTDSNIIKSLLEKQFNIKDWNLVNISEDGVVDVMDNISNKGSMLRFPVQFGEVKGDFWCFSASLLSLEGAPRRVQGDFDCSNNHLTSLEGSPRKVHKDFICTGNQATLKNLEGISAEIGGGVYFSGSRVKSLKGSPSIVKGNFVVDNNVLRDLVGAPEYVEKSFWCHGNDFTSLDGFPKKVGERCLIDYREDLGLLRTLAAATVRLNAEEDDAAAKTVQTILDKYAGQGKRALFDCQKELEDSGFEGNARW